MILNLQNFTLVQGLGKFQNWNITMDLGSSQNNFLLIYILQSNWIGICVMEVAKLYTAIVDVIKGKQ